MNHSSPGLTISTCIDGFVNFKIAEGLSQRSVDAYETILRKWLARIGERPIGTISANDLTAHLAWLRTEYQPSRFNGLTHPLSPKTIRNVWVTFKAYFGWASQELNLPNPAKDLVEPRFQKASVQTFSRDEVNALLKACLYARAAKTDTRRTFQMRRPTANRDQAIILILVDTGLRVSELCSLTIGNVDLKSGKVSVKHGIQGGEKGGKGRLVYLGKVARKALWHYLTKREDQDQPNAPLILNLDERPFTKDSLRILLGRIGKRAGIQKTFLHKFRHTFAITYLRSGGDVFTLQALLGHSSLDMVRHYAQIAEVDIEQAHRKESPADNWRL